MVRRYISVVSTRSFIPHPPLPPSLLAQLREWSANTPAWPYARHWRGGHTASCLSWSSAGVGPQSVRPVTVAELHHNLALDLANPLAGQAEQLADLVKRAGLSIVEPEAQPDHLMLALVEGGQHRADVGVQQLGDHRVLRGHRFGVLDEVTQRRLFLGADRHVEAHRVAAVLQQVVDLLDRDAGLCSEFLVSGFPAEILV